MSQKTDPELASIGKHENTLTTIQSTAIGTSIPTVHIRKNFTPLQIIALGFNVSNSWVGIAVSIVFAIAAGGSVTLIYGVLIAGVVYGAVALSCAELASIYPTAGGQYHFTSFVAPASYKRQASYWCGIIAAFSWIALCTAATLIAAQGILGVVAALRPTYEPVAWHYFLTYQAVNVVVFLYNLLVLKKTLWIHDVGFFLTLSLFLVSTITCLALSTKQFSSQVWTSFTNESGWSNPVAFITGLVTPFFMYAGIDASMHVAEEVQNPRKMVPYAIISTWAIGFISAFVFTVASCYSIADLNTLLSSVSPIHELWRQATSNNAIATTFLIALFFVLLFAINAMQQTASHMIWALGRDDALIFSKHIATIHPILEVPVWGLLVNSGCILITGCLYMASTAAFNALVNSTVTLQMISFAIPCFILMLEKRSEAVLPRNRVFKLPSWLGWGCNALVVVFAIIETVFFCFPTAIPTTGSSMNYTVAILGVFGIFGAGNWWCHAKKHYHGPTIDLVGF